MNEPVTEDEVREIAATVRSGGAVKIFLREAGQDYTVTVGQFGQVIVYSEHGSSTVSRKEAGLIHAALGAWLARQGS